MMSDECRTRDDCDCEACDDRRGVVSYAAAAETPHTLAAMAALELCGKHIAALELCGKYAAAWLEDHPDDGLALAIGKIVEGRMGPLRK